MLAAMDLACAAAPHPIPDATSLLVDQVGALSSAERDSLLSSLQSIQNSGRAQVAILISGGTDGEALADYGLRVAEKWQLGRAGKDDGLLILVVPSSTAARIEVGYGLEGAIPDARASRWLDELLPAMKNKELAKGLDRLLDQIDDVLPRAAAKTAASEDNFMFPDHPEWRLPFALVVFSPFALFPLFMGRWGGVVGAPMLAGFYGGAAWGLWESTTATLAVAGAVFPLPFLWALNWRESEYLAPWLRYARAIGNLIGVALFFAVITLFVGAGLSAAGAEEVWVAPIFAGLLAIGVAVFLFPGKPAQVLMIVLRSLMHFAFILAVAYVSLQPFMPHPAGIAFAVAGAFTAFAALGLYLDSRERARGAAAGGIRWSLWCFGLAILVALPFGLLALVLAAGGEDAQTQLTQAAAGGGTIAGILALAARYGLFAAVKVGLGGLFGGGGAGRDE
jgi:uncharacterized protein